VNDSLETRTRILEVFVEQNHPKEHTRLNRMIHAHRRDLQGGLDKIGTRVSANEEAIQAANRTRRDLWIIATVALVFVGVDKFSPAIIGLILRIAKFFGY